MSHRTAHWTPVTHEKYSAEGEGVTCSCVSKAAFVATHCRVVIYHHAEDFKGRHQFN